MDVRFHVDPTLSLSARPLFFVLGDVVQGEVRTGMEVSAKPAEGMDDGVQHDDPDERAAPTWRA